MITHYAIYNPAIFRQTYIKKRENGNPQTGKTRNKNLAGMT